MLTAEDICFTLRDGSAQPEVSLLSDCSSGQNDLFHHCPDEGEALLLDTDLAHMTHP